MTENDFKNDRNGLGRFEFHSLPLHHISKVTEETYVHDH
jgi:hypothetical protein